MERGGKKRRLCLGLLGCGGSLLSGAESLHVTLSDVVEVLSELLVHALEDSVVLLCRLLDAVAVLLEALVVVSVVLTLCHFFFKYTCTYFKN